MTDKENGYPEIWTDAEVAVLNAHQADGLLHPYTCPGNKPSCANQRNLIATRSGWICQCGEYRQGWARGVGHDCNPETTSEPDDLKHDGCAEGPPVDLCSIEIDALRHALDALSALQSAQLCTQDGFTSDYLENAADEVRKAMKGMGV